MNLKSFIVYSTIILLITVISYRKAAYVPYIYDDKEIIQRDGAFDANGFMNDLFSKKYYSRFGERTYRPVATASFIIDKKLWNLSPVGTHVFNIILHCAIAILVFLTLVRFNISSFWSFWGALLFAVHPVKIEAVALASNREELLCALFFFAAFLAFLSRTRISEFLSLLFFALAIFSKEMAASLPIILAAHFVYFNTDKQDAFSKIKKCVTISLPYIMILGFFIFLKYTILSNPVGDAALPGGSPVSALMIMSNVFLKYVSLLIYPAKFCADYVVNAPPDLLPIVFLVVSIFSPLLLWKYWKTGGFGIAFFLITLLPVSNILPFGETMAERYLYIPSFALSLGYAKIFDLWGARILKIVPAALMIFLLSYGTSQRLVVWQTETSYWENAAACAPDSSEAWTNLGNIQLRNNDPVLALIMYNRAKNCSSFISEEKFFYNQGLALYQLGKFNEAEESFINSVNNSFKPVLPYYQLAKIESEKGNPIDGLKFLESAINNDPENDLSFYILSQYYLNNFGDKRAVELAIGAMSKAISISPDNPLYYAALANIFMVKGDTAEAEKVLMKCLKIKPGFPAAELMLRNIKKHDE